MKEKEDSVPSARFEGFRAITPNLENLPDYIGLDRQALLRGIMFGVVPWALILYPDRELP